MVARIWIVYVFLFIVYSLAIYVGADKNNSEGVPNIYVSNGWQIWQEKNCQSCHQLYGLGGYMGPDLTNIFSNDKKGKVYMSAIIKNGTTKMPNFHLNDTEVEHIVQFLGWVDKSGASQVKPGSVVWPGTYKIDK